MKMYLCQICVGYSIFSENQNASLFSALLNKEKETFNIFLYFNIKKFGKIIKLNFKFI